MTDKSKATRHLNMPQDAAPMPQRPTGPLDHLVPWVIEFRIVGTAYIIQVSATEEVNIGRSDPKRGLLPEVDLTPYAAHVLGVSRQHARVNIRSDGITVQDLSSANGTFLNGHVLNPNQEYRLRDGDQLSFGQLHVQVHFVVTPSTETEEALKTSEVAITSIGSGQHILVVDDDVDVARVFDTILERAGFKVTMMMNAVDAMNLITRQMPDIIILEMMLPDMNGDDFIRAVRKQENGADVPIIAVTGAPGTQAREAGADVVLHKPVSVEEILQAVSSVVQKLGEK